MPKSLVLGNGNILVGLDQYGQVKDFYFPYVGLENQVSSEVSNVHKIGVWTDGALHWLNNSSWEITIDCAPETLASNIRAENKTIGISLHFEDVVYNEKNIFIRAVTVSNKRDEKREIKLFFHAGFELYGSHRGDTGYYDPLNHVIIHYEGKRVFLINMMLGDRKFDDYSVGLYHLAGMEGTYRDAEDGILSKNPIEHGTIDSIVGFTVPLNAREEETLYYWIAVAKTHKEVLNLNQYALVHTPAHLSKTTRDFWHALVNKQNFTFYGLPENVIALFKKSLLYIRAQTDNHGAIIASTDSDMLHYGRDTYNYSWPRDGAVSALALAKAGHSNIARRFFEFAAGVVSEYGYFMHKYRPDGTWGSSWHPWVRNGKPALPIQEDETAFVIEALWHYYDISRDLEFIEGLYNPLIQRAAQFMVGHIDVKTGLPKASYDLWEERFITSAFTASAVYGALISAQKFSELLGKTERAKEYREVADRIQEAILKNLYDEKEKMFIRGIDIERTPIVPDKTLDASSAYGIYRFGVLPLDDPRVMSSIETVKEKLCCQTSVGGVPRYTGDDYYWNSGYPVRGNPWFVTTLWFAQYYIMAAKKEEDLGEAKKWFSWTASHATPAGILSEQISPDTGEQISAAPLTWSHAEFVISIAMYLEKLEELGVCKACYPLA